MLNPKEYRNEFEDSSLRKVLQERDKIIDFMRAFENNQIPKKYFERELSPEFVYFRYIEYLKEICDLIKIKMHEKNQTVKASPFRAIEEVISKFDTAKREEFFEDLKIKDEELYNEYMEWKRNEEELI